MFAVVMVAVVAIVVVAVAFPFAAVVGGSGSSRKVLTCSNLVVVVS